MFLAACTENTAHVHTCFSFDNQLDQREQKFWTQRTSLLKLKGHHAVTLVMQNNGLFSSGTHGEFKCRLDSIVFPDICQGIRN